MAIKKLFKRLVCRSGKAAADEENGLSDELVDKSNGKRGSREGRTSNRNKKSKPEGMISRYYQELVQRDPFIIEEVDGKFIDLRASFTPKPKWWLVPVKLVILAWTCLVLADGVIDTDPRPFYLATFDHWTLVMTILYLFCSTLCNALRAPSTTKSTDSSPEGYLPTIWHRITWALFAIAAPSQLLSTLIFWTIQFQRSTDSIGTSLARYASLPVLLIVEGLWINRTPLRVNHQWFFFAFVFAFLLWSLIHSYTGIGNPTVEDKDYDDLYSFLDWNGNPIMSAVYSFIGMFIAVPVIYWLVWLLSLFSCPFNFVGKNRRYLDKNEGRRIGKYLEELDSEQIKAQNTQQP